MLLALSLNTQQQAIREGIPTRVPDATAALRITEHSIKLQKELAEYKDRFERLAKLQAAGTSGAEGLEKALSEAKLFAGTVAVRGPGLICTLQDSPKLDKNETDREIIESHIIHDYDIRAVVNELFSAGAEAISVNGQRIVATTSIRCGGAPILINSVRVAPPYVVTAAGRPKDLEEALRLQGGPADGLFLLDMIDIKREPNVLVPAFTGSTRFTAVQPVTGQGRR